MINYVNSSSIIILVMIQSVFMNHPNVIPVLLVDDFLNEHVYQNQVTLTINNPWNDYFSFKGSSLERPQYYGPSDFYIGAKIEVFRQRFIIRSADLFVLKYAEEHPEQFTPTVIESLRQHLSNQQGRPDARLRTNIRVQRKPGDFIRLYAEIRNKLKHMRITNHEEIRQMFLRYDRDRNGYITRENILDLFRQINLPLENDLVDAVRRNLKFIYLIFDI